MDGVDPVLLISRWLHLAAAMAALGAALYMRIALIPAANEQLSPDDHQRLREALRRRWAPVVHASVAVLFLTGFLNFFLMVISPKIKPMPYHAIFGVKLLAALFIFFIAEALVGSSPGTTGIRGKRARWLTILLVTGGLVVALSGVLNQIRTHQLRNPLPVAVSK